jgi:hypothetical protein
LAVDDIHVGVCQHLFDLDVAVYVLDEYLEVPGKCDDVVDDIVPALAFSVLKGLDRLLRSCLPTLKNAIRAARSLSLATARTPSNGRRCLIWFKFRSRVSNQRTSV